MTLELEPSGDLRARVTDDRRALTLRDSRGHPVLLYRGLSAYDSDLRELPTWIEPRDTRVVLRVDATAARYPVFVDPFIQDMAYVFVKPPGGWVDATETARLIPSDVPYPPTMTTTLFGSTVDISGNTIVVGAPWDPPGQSKGAAYVFVRPPGGWADMVETAKLTATARRSGALSRDRFPGGAHHVSHRQSTQGWLLRPGNPGKRTLASAPANRVVAVPDPIGDPLRSIRSFT